MATLIDVIAMLKSEAITYAQTSLIDGALVAADPRDIPEKDIGSVKNYIDLQLAHNNVHPPVKARLERLYEQLQVREAGA